MEAAGNGGVGDGGGGDGGSRMEVAGMERDDVYKLQFVPS